MMGFWAVDTYEIFFVCFLNAIEVDQTLPV